jgi:hypothetical protein
MCWLAKAAIFFVLRNWLTSCKSPVYRHKTFTPEGMTGPMAAGK